MNPEWVRRTIIDAQRRRHLSLAEAAADLIQGAGLTDSSVVDQVLADLREECRRNQLLDIPAGVHSVEYKVRAGDAGEDQWYLGPQEGDVYWPRLRVVLEQSGLAAVVNDIDAASTKVVGHFADPGIRRLKKKGLVVGYVQSGKTANYTAVIAKAADAGFKLFIVLSGMHNNLRRQTQVRVQRDLRTSDWGELTTSDSDFGTVVNGAALLLSENPSIAVVKKNASRLRRLRDWLRDIDDGIRARCPILILDDEADQATPNSAAARGELSKINELVRQIWAEVPTGSYVGYTATPFANVFMDPSDDEELYPSNFILDLPRPAEYFGAERLFGRAELPDADAPDEPVDMIRSVPDEDAQTLKPPSGREERESFDPELPDSLLEALRWFVLATAVRRARGQVGAHSSMLIHTTAFVAPHFAMKDQVNDHLDALRAQVQAGRTDLFRKQFIAEVDRASEVRTVAVPSWDEVVPWLEPVLNDSRVVVDNGYSTDRLDYGRNDDDGKPIVETVIAVGGGTLSRGLTLEGLVVSYFTRSSNTYDTLLQMGRWFGYRPGYEDLPRIWMPDDLRRDFEFLALVEEEIRLDMRQLEAKGITPSEFGVRVRAHPGRLAITAAGKMFHANLVKVSFAGQRHQTFILHEANTESLQANIDATRRLVATCLQTGVPGVRSVARHQFFDVPADAVLEFLAEYQIHPDQPGIRSDHVVGWIKQCAVKQPWNVVFVGSSRSATREDGTAVDLGTVDLGFAEPLPMVNRAPLAVPQSGFANIKALLSQPDWVADADPELVRETRERDESYASLRRKLGLGSTGLLIVYAVSDKSEPLRNLQKKSRRASTAMVPQIGLGIVFPDMPEALTSTDADYYSVHPDWTAIMDEEADLPVDIEGSTDVDGEVVAGGPGD